MKLLSIGSVVKLHNGDSKLMILNRYPLYNSNGTIGYFEYSGTLYPAGKVEEHAYFFNHENIKEVYFEGYIDEDEEKLQEFYKTEVENIKYPRFSIETSE